MWPTLEARYAAFPQRKKLPPHQYIIVTHFLLSKSIVQLHDTGVNNYIHKFSLKYHRSLSVRDQRIIPMNLALGSSFSINIDVET